MNGKARRKLKKVSVVMASAAFATTPKLSAHTEIQRLSRDTPDHPSAVQLTAVYHNLLRRWADL